MIVTEAEMTPIIRHIIDGRIVYTDLIEVIVSAVILTSNEEEIIDAVMILFALVSKEFLSSKPFSYSDCKFLRSASSFSNSSLSLLGLLIFGYSIPSLIVCII